MTYSSRTSVTPNNRYQGGVGAPGAMGGAQQTATGTVLRLIIENMYMPVCIDDINAVCSRHGSVLRIVTFEKKNFQALIEFTDADCVNRAIAGLDGRDLFPGSCLLRASPSTTPAPLKVIANNERARDYTGQVGGAALQQYGTSTPASYGAARNPGMAPPQAPFRGYPQAAGGAYGMQQHRGHPMMGGMGGGSPVVLVTGLPEDDVTPSQLSTLFGVYGDVMRVKILYKKKSNAMVEFRMPGHAQRAIANLSGITFAGQRIKVIQSRNPSVSCPPPSATHPDSGLARDFSDSKQHRFIKAGSKNERHIAAPSATLFASGLPDGTVADELAAVFTSPACLNAEMMSTSSKMGFVNFESIEDAIQALVNMHQTEFKGRSLQLTFSQHRKASRAPAAAPAVDMM